jgi:hypothetical protein
MTSKSKVLILALTVAVGQGLVCGEMARRRVFYGPRPPFILLADVKLYHYYATAAVVGHVPYLDYRIEYPLLAFPLMLGPRLLTSDLGRYRGYFALELLLFNAAAVVAVALWIARREGPANVGGRLAWYSIALLALCPLAIARFDLAPTCVAFLAALAWFSGRPASGGVLAASGVLMKIFPGVIAGPGLVWDLKQRGRAGWRGVAALAVALILGAGAWFTLGGRGVSESLRYHLDRGLESGSVYTGLLGLWLKWTGVPIRTESLYGSSQLVSPGADTLAKLALPLQALALLLVLWRSRRTILSEPMRWSAASVVTFITFGKVLSPQFLVWPLPFLAVVPGLTGRLARPIFLAACLVTTLIYPWAPDHVATLDGWGLLLLNLRNSLLIALWLLLVFGPSAPATAPRSPSSPPAARSTRFVRIIHP